jgi:NADPH:quinone reductase-like Zn-dependent oxidoreductase
MNAQDKMKAAMYYKYGSPDVISIAETAMPVPKESEVLIQIKAASVGAYDWHILRAKPFFTRALSGVFRPKNKILGADIAGVVAEVGNGTTKFNVGDEIFGCLESCGKGGLATGGFAEYVCAKESVLALKSPALSFEEAAALPMSSVTALQGLRQAQVSKGTSVLINGASGGVGAFAVQIAKSLGAEVTGVCSTGSVDFVRSLGADTIIDYKNEAVVADGKQYDVVIDIAATLSVKDYRCALKTGGRCVVIGFSTLGHALSYGFAGKSNGKTIKLWMANNKDSNDLLEINKFVEAGWLRVIIDSRYPLAETAEALRRTESGHPRGKVVLQV